jgi:hypothetical protein
MAWYHVGGCDCPIGCCDCGEYLSRKRTVYMFYSCVSDNMFIFSDRKFGKELMFIDSFEEDKKILTDDEVMAIEAQAEACRD